MARPTGAAKSATRSSSWPFSRSRQRSKREHALPYIGVIAGTRSIPGWTETVSYTHLTLPTICSV
eukprot:2268480-Alexandrium_andersonii.AAC.1